jgi:two-component system invasion response regulator UvrY
MHQPADPIKIALVDDHTLIRDALATVINNFQNCEVVILASHGKELIEKVGRSARPDVVILDLNMPEMDGYETAKWLKDNYPEISVLVLTMYDSELALIRLLKCGARGFLKKDIHPDELRFAIESVVNSGFYYSNNSTGKLINLFKKDEPFHSMNVIILSENELAFLKLAGTDKTYKEIAAEMTVSPRTIDNYRDSLFLKLNVKSRVGLVMYAIRNGIITNYQ